MAKRNPGKAPNLAQQSHRRASASSLRGLNHNVLVLAMWFRWPLTLKLDGIDIGKLAADLTHSEINSNTVVHLDPDLHSPSLERVSGWRPAFGQIGAAQSHLNNQNVGIDDVFLFFGWFRSVECINGNWRYVPNSMDMHVLFGWLQIGEVLSVSQQIQEIVTHHPWLLEHPHISSAGRFRSTNNTIYVSSDSLVSVYPYHL